MQWVDRMNLAIDYLETHLTEQIDPVEISRIVACPYSVFQRSFAPITGYSCRNMFAVDGYPVPHTTFRIQNSAYWILP